MNIRRRSLTDSMQLLVDTICNLFGSIIIISLLMAVLSKDSSPEAAARERASKISTEIRQTQTQLDEERRLQSNLTPPDADEMRRLAIAGEIAELKGVTASNLAAIRSNSAPVIHPGAQQTFSIEDLQSQKSALQTDLADLTNQLARLKQSSTRQLRLPREHATGKKTYYFICRFGKIYPVHIMREGQRELNTQTLDWRQTAAGESAVPRRELGFDPATGLQAFTRLFNEISGQLFSIHFLVYPDSFPAFLNARQIPLERNFDTGWEFLTEDEPIVFSSRGEAPPAL
jgi:hypothetical protein